MGVVTGLLAGRGLLGGGSQGTSLVILPKGLDSASMVSFVKQPGEVRKESLWCLDSV